MLKLIKAMDRAADRVIVAAGGVSAILLLLIAFGIFLEIVSRTLFGFSFFYFFEFAVFATIFIGFLGSAYCLRTGHMITIDVFTSRLSEPPRAILNIVGYIIGMIFMLVLIWKGGEWAYMCYTYGVMEQTAIPMPRVALASTVPLCGFFLLVQTIREIVKNVHILLKSGVLNKPFSPRPHDNPLVALSLLIIGLIISVVLLFYVNLIAGIIFLTLVLLFSGMPTAFVLGSIGVVGLFIFFEDTAKLIQAPIASFGMLNSFVLSCLPLFILGGLIISRGGLANKIMVVMERWVWRFPPSLMISSVAACGVFCAITGSSASATAVMSEATLPELIKRGYKRSFACGAIAGGTIGGLVPPGIGLLTYGIMTDNSIAEIFMGALLPSIVVFSMYFTYIIVRMYVMKEHVELAAVPSWREKFSCIKEGFWGLLAPVLILGGVYSGWFTPTEVASVLVIYAIVVTCFILRSLNWRGLIDASFAGLHTALMILSLIIGAVIFSIFIAQCRLDVAIVEWAQGTGLTTFTTFLFMFIMLTIMGLFIGAVEVLLITLPLFYPLAMAAGIDPIWLGVFYIINLEVGMLTPPVGLNLFIIRGVSDIPLGEIIRGTFPFMVMLASLCFIIYFFPQLVLWLPSTMR